MTGWGVGMVRLTDLEVLALACALMALALLIVAAVRAVEQRLNSLNSERRATRRG